MQAKVEVSYMEIYNEKVHDLLDLTANGKIGLKVGMVWIRNYLFRIRIQQEWKGRQINILFIIFRLKILDCIVLHVRLKCEIENGI